MPSGTVRPDLKLVARRFGMTYGWMGKAGWGTGRRVGGSWTASLGWDAWWASLGCRARSEA